MAVVNKVFRDCRNEILRCPKERRLQRATQFEQEDERDEVVLLSVPESLGASLCRRLPRGVPPPPGRGLASPGPPHFRALCPPLILILIYTVSIAPVAKYSGCPGQSHVRLYLMKNSGCLLVKLEGASKKVQESLFVKENILKYCTIFKQ